MIIGQPLWLLTLVPILAGLWVWTRRDPSPVRAALTACTAALLALGAAGLALRTEPVGRRHVLVVDRSESVLPFFSHADLEALVRDHAAKFRPEDRVGLVLFGREAIIAHPLMPAQAFHQVDLGGYTVRKDGTNLGRAMALAGSMLPAGGEILLVSDGRDNAGEWMEGLWELRSRKIALHTASMGRAPGGDFGVESLEGPAVAPAGTPVTLSARIVSWSGGEAVVRFRDGRGTLIGKPQTRTFLPGETRIFLSEPFHPEAEGEPRYTVHVEPVIGRDPVPGNDGAETVIRVGGHLRALVVYENPPDRLFGKLLETLPGWKVQKARPFQLGSHPRLEGWDLVVLDGVEADALGEARMRAVEAFVRDGGGGLLLLGGPEAYGLGGYFDTPVERASPVRCDPEEKNSLALILLLDASASMNEPTAEGRTKFLDAKYAAGKLLRRLRPGDFVALIPFSENPRLDPRLQAVVQEGPLASIEKWLYRVEAGGATSILRALGAAREVIAGRTEARKHILLFSDGVETMKAEDQTRRFREHRKAFEAAKVTVSAAVTASRLTPPVRTFVQGEIVLKGKMYAVKEFALLPRDFVEDVTRARGNLLKRGGFPAVPGSPAPGLPVFRPPPVEAFVRTGLKKEMASEAVVVGGEDYPLLAWWRYGLGRAVAFTSSLDGDWSPAWRKWGRSPESPEKRSPLESFWGAWVRWAAREEGGGAVSLTRTNSGLEVRVRGRGAVDLEDGLGLRARLLLKGKTVRESDLLQEGPGLYATAFPMVAPGYYRVVVYGGEGRRVFGEGGLYAGSSVEMGALGPDGEALKRLRSGSGRFWEDPAAFLPSPGRIEGAGFHEVGWVFLAASAFSFILYAFRRKGGR
ncbi:MAG: vWA domain-containing protein [Planctomycetota bacterium]|jgi:hypothetical protein